LLALSHQKRFPHLRHEAPHRLALAGEYAGAGVGWTLCRGDVLEHLATQPAADVVFYDPFSAKVDAELWRSDAFTRVWARVRRPCELFTYSASTAARAALLGAGFFVAAGAPSAGRPETTVALAIEGTVVPAELAAHRLLDASWLARWSRSTARHPAGTEPAAGAALDALVSAHPQFRGG
jgi:queuine tRNA-ribosyltransferase